MDEKATDRKRVDTIIRQADERINYRFDFVDTVFCDGHSLRAACVAICPTCPQTHVVPEAIEQKDIHWW